MFKKTKDKKFSKFFKIKNKKIYSEKQINNNNKNIKIKIEKSGKIPIEQLNSTLLLLKKKFNKNQYKLNILVDFFSTKKPIETRMGKGRGDANIQGCWVKNGQIFLEFKGICIKKNYKYLNKFKKKIGLKTKLNLNENYW